MNNCPTPYRLLVLKALTEVLEGVNPLNGYSVNLKDRVFRGVGEFGDESPDTMLAILESPRPDYGEFAGQLQARSEGWSLFIQGTCPLADDTRFPTDPLYYMAADVENRLSAVIAERGDGSGRAAFPEMFLLGKNERTGGTLITGLEIGPPVIRPASQSTRKAFFYITLRVGLAEILG